MAPGSEPSAPSSKTPTLGSSTTNALIAATTAPPALSSPCSPPPASSSSPTDWPIYDNRLLGSKLAYRHHIAMRHRGAGNGPDCGCQITLGVWLGEPWQVRAVFGVVRKLGVSGRQNDRQGGMALLQSTGKLQSGHSRHR